MSLPPIDEGIKEQLSKDLYTFVMNNPHKTDIAWHEIRRDLSEFLVSKGYCIYEWLTALLKEGYEYKPN